MFECILAATGALSGTPSIAWEFLRDMIHASCNRINGLPIGAKKRCKLRVKISFGNGKFEHIYLSRKYD